jgi:uncharacterized protein
MGTERTGIGIGLRWEYLDAVLDSTPEDLEPVRFFEIAPENYMRRGGWIPRTLEKVVERHPVTTHGLMMSLGGLDPLDGAYLTELRAFLERIEVPRHTDHLSFSTFEGGALHELLPVPFDSGSAARIAARIRQAQDVLGRPLAVENVSYYLTLGSQPADEAAFLEEVLELADCGLLLDVNNLDVNSRNHGFDPYAWLEHVPLNRVVEIHVAGPERGQGGLLIDTHGAPVPSSVHELLAHVIRRIGPIPVLLERDNNLPELSELIVEARALDVTYRQALGHCPTACEVSTRVA